MVENIKNETYVVSGQSNVSNRQEIVDHDAVQYLFHFVVFAIFLIALISYIIRKILKWKRNVEKQYAKVCTELSEIKVLKPSPVARS